MLLKNLIPFIGLVLFFGCKEAPKEEVQTPAVETVVTEVAVLESTFQDLEGNPVALSDFQGKRIFLNYWATWCRPCIEEMPAIERLQTILEKENYVFLLASDQDITKIAKFKAARDFDFNYVKFNGNLADQQITALPVTIIYNELGELMERFDGGEVWDAPEMIQKLTALHE